MSKAQMSYVHTTFCIFVIFLENRFCGHTTFVLQTIHMLLKLFEVDVLQELNNGLYSASYVRDISKPLHGECTMSFLTNNN